MEVLEALGQFCVLIAEDDPQLRLFIENKLTDAGIVAYSVDNGQATLDAVERFKPDILLLDIMMPVMDGFEVLRRIKSGPLRDKINIIMITALARDEDVAEAADLGATDYLIKPINLDELVSLVEVVQNRKRLSD